MIDKSKTLTSADALAARLGAKLDANRKPPLKEPTLAQMAGNFASAMHDWIGAGLPVASREVALARHAVCSGCSYWNGKARFGLGKCTHKDCGCTNYKVWLATSRCPEKKWAE